MGGIALAGDRAIGDNGPFLWGLKVQGVGGLQIRLVEAGKDALGIGSFKLGVEVDLVIGRVHEAVQALAGAGEGDLRDDLERVVRYLQPGEWNAVGGVIGLRGQRVSIQAHLVQLVRAQIDEGRTGLLGAKAHRSGGQEVGIGMLKV